MHRESPFFNPYHNCEVIKQINCVRLRGGSIYARLWDPKLNAMLTQSISLIQIQMFEYWSWNMYLMSWKLKKIYIVFLFSYSNVLAGAASSVLCYKQLQLLENLIWKILKYSLPIFDFEVWVLWLPKHWYCVFCNSSKNAFFGFWTPKTPSPKTPKTISRSPKCVGCRGSVKQ